MVDGQLNKRVVFIIQARMKSTRLPGKVLLPIPINNGKPLIQWIIDEARNSKYCDALFVATSKSEENNILEEYCNNHNINCIRGDEEDVLSRFILIIKDSEYTDVIRLTADNPILDTASLDEAVEYHLKWMNDYTNTQGLPLGMNFEIVKKTALLNSVAYPLDQQEKEHVTLFIKRNNKFKKGTYSFSFAEWVSRLRLTIDYATDYLVLSAVLGFSLQKNESPSISLILELFKSYPWIFETNSSNIQKRHFKGNEEFEYAIDLLKQFHMDNASKLLKNAVEK